MVLPVVKIVNSVVSVLLINSELFVLDELLVLELHDHTNRVNNKANPYTVLFVNLYNFVVYRKFDKNP